MSRRVFGFISLTVIAMMAVGLMMFTLLGTATGAAGNASASAYGVRVSLDTPLTSLALIGPLPRVAADKFNVTAKDALLKIGEVPAGGALIQEIAALKVESAVNLATGTASGLSETAHIGLIKNPTAPPLVPGGGGLLGGILGGLPVIGPLLGPGQGTSGNAIDLSAVKGVANLNCNTLASLQGLNEVGLLNAITAGSRIAQVEVQPLDLKLAVVDTLKDSLGNPNDDHAAGFHLRIDLGLLGLPSLRVVEIWLYEVQGNNLRTPSLTNSTVGVTVDMVHVKVLDKATGLLEADIKIGHTEASLSNCGAAPIPNPSVSTPPGVIIPPAVQTRDVPVTKAIESINGVVIASQEGLTARPGQEIEYSITVFNRSISSCAVTSVVDQIPLNMTLVSTAGDLGGGRYDPISNTVIWDGLSIPSGSARRQGIVVRLAANAPNGTYVNRAIADGSCGRFEGIAPGILVREATVLGTRFTT
ncbi:MAG: hypothetical protein ACRDJM_06240, partial [Actinomycetota bacterium]